MNAFKTADLCDQFELKARACTTQFRHFGKRRTFSGQVETIKTFEDAGLVLERIKLSGNGKLLVVDGGGSLRFSLVGDKMSRLASENGWAGIVVFGAVRDVAEIDVMDFGVLALGTAPARASKDGKGQWNVPLRFGEVEFVPGHLAYCDADGLVVLENDARLAR